VGCKVSVGSGACVADEHAEIINASKIVVTDRVLIIFNTILCAFFVLASQRFALAAGGRAWIRLGSRKKPEARKMLENAAESHQSAARFVSPVLFGVRPFLIFLYSHYKTLFARIDAIERVSLLLQLHYQE
jgi:hypothetical protein